MTQSFSSPPPENLEFVPSHGAAAEVEKQMEAQELEMELAQYRKSVETLMELESTAAISNSIPAHAAILIETFFKHAKEHVRIFCRNLKADVFNQPTLVEAARAALERGIRITVVTQDEPDASAFLDLIKKQTTNAKLRRATNPATNAAFDFAVMDRRAVRVEPDRQEIKAQAVMNAPSYASKLVDTFDAIIQRMCREMHAA